MKLYTNPCYNPFFIDIKERKHQIDKIHVFDDGIILASSRCGWFDTGNNSIKELTLNVECIAKRKVDLFCKTAFVVKCGEDFGESRYALYIPNSVVMLSAPSYEKIYSGTAIRQTIVSQINSGIVFTQVYWLNKEVSKIESQITEIGKEISSLYSVKYDNLPTLIDTLTCLHKQRQDAVDRMHQVTIDDFIKTIHNGG